MSEWKTIKLKDFVTLKRGYDLPHNKSREGNYPVITSTNIRGYHDEYKIDSPVVTVGRSGSIGKVQIVNEKAWPLNTTLYVKDSKGNNINFIYYYLQTMGLEQFNSGAGVPTLNRNHIGLLKIKIPDIKQQEKIANVLSTYDELIENNNRRIEVLEQIAEEIYKEWFVRMRFPGYENTSFIKGIPEGWGVKRIEELAKFKRGSNLVNANAIQGEVPVIAGGMKPSCYHNQANTEAPVITVSASGANAGYTQLNHVAVWASDCSYLDTKETDLIHYLYLLLKVSHREILNLQVGSAQPHVYARDLNNFKFLKPTEELILKMNNIAKEIFNQIKNLTSVNQNLKKQRDLLLPRLMNGTIEVK
ncbi:restriction endonuclease subunit S [Mammaliicoccus lentus]|uniref:restriction endonuclease subunit S n=1 Tax=Mammaliicoccus lentus TaxID=42858 RepID=UPI0026496E05|nr:restriction endonuclease subunit S [Mammaliicoccus lentus]